ncbi:hypothetical protein BG004_005830 [Podila humilis]|nr:hypothetical protein BG004_005830 [Podila humilis]
MSPYGTIPRPISTQSLTSILPRHAALRPSHHDNVNANTTLFHITIAESLTAEESIFTIPGKEHPALVEAMRRIFNAEVLRGDTYPHETELDSQGFASYFFGGDAFVAIRGAHASAKDVSTSRTTIEEWDLDLLGFFYIKPNFPGRCSHICNGGFMVNPSHRGLGIGAIMGKAFLRLVPVIGYRASMFNLVFVSNVASIKLWQGLGFLEIGRIPKAGRLRGKGSNPEQETNEGYIDAIQFFWDFETMPVPDEY